MIVLKSRHELEVMRTTGSIVGEILETLKAQVRPGVSTAELDDVAARETRRLKARPAFKGYQVGSNVFPATLCVSINDEIVHGIPSAKRILRSGDIVGIDFGVCYQGYFCDAAATVAVGEVDEKSLRLMNTTEEALWLGIAQMKVGNRVGDISAAVQEHVEEAGFSIVRDFVGHGIGTKLHELPQLPNFGPRGRGVRLRAGMVLAIEPMVNAGGPEIRMLAEGWPAVTRDGSRSAHYEHSVAITDQGPVVLTAPEGTATQRMASVGPERSGRQENAAHAPLA